MEESDPTPAAAAVIESTFDLIEPSTFDLIVIGTGLPESIVSAAVSHSGKTVLHLDPNPFYGSHFSSLSPSNLSEFLLQNSRDTPTSTYFLQSNSNDRYVVVNLSSRPVYSDVEIYNYAPQSLTADHKFNLDISGPRVLFCADKSIDLILKSQVNHYLEFKPIDASFVGDANGTLSLVPDSRAAIFKDKTLGLVDKNLLMTFFKLVQQHWDQQQDDVSISDDDLETPFLHFLTKMKLPRKIQNIILYAIAMENYDQEQEDHPQGLILKTRDGIHRLFLYNTSIARFQNSLGPMIYPLYGLGELPQAFCRRAAVKGCIHVLRMPVLALLMDKDTGQYRGVRLSSGQEIFSDKLVLDSSYTPQLSLASSPPLPLRESLQGLTLTGVQGKVVRGICITSSSLKPDLASFLIVFPLRSLYLEQVVAIRILQIAADLAVCPPDIDVNEGKKLLLTAMNALLKVPTLDCPQTHSTENNESMKEEKPILLWSALYAQELPEGQFGTISSFPMPDGNLNFNDLLDVTVKMFQRHNPNEDLFPEISKPETSENDDELNLDA
ncbi:hypothetical protein ACFE04_027267 [Oxalis oulophora]